MGWGAEGAKYRFQWTFPIVISPHDPNTVYAGSNVLHRSTDEGQSWQVISPDLTRNDKTKLGPSGGPITKDNTSVEYYCTIFAVAESPVTKGVLWVGSDDGLVHVSRDGGTSWQNVTPSGVPAWSEINQIDPSPHDAATAYVAATRYKFGRLPPIRVRDARLRQELAVDRGQPPCRCVRARRARGPGAEGPAVLWHRDRPLLDARRWRSLATAQAQPPRPDQGSRQARRRGARRAARRADHGPGRQDDDLVVATQGRAFWILDDIAPLRQLTKESTSAAAWLFAPSPASCSGAPGDAARARIRRTARSSTTASRASPRTRRRSRSSSLTPRAR